MRLWDTPFWIGVRQFTAEDIAFIEAMVRDFRHLSRSELAATVCEKPEPSCTDLWRFSEF